MRKKLNNLNNYITDTVNTFIHRENIPIFYFSKTKNVGDILNPYLIQKISGKETTLVRSRRVKHILPIGSIIHFGTEKSTVWGSGIIHPSQLPPENTLKKMRYKAIRGLLTKQELKNYNINLGNIPLGDPAVLLPIYYSPQKSARRFKVGIVPHFVDADNPILLKYLNNKDVLIIDVKQNPEDFIDKINSCDYILSSSLHGLIISDSYKVPNAWLRFSDKVIGGDFKFHDYYSTTDKVNFYSTGPINIYNQEILDNIIDCPAKFCEVNHYIYNKQDLLATFPYIL